MSKQDLVLDGILSTECYQECFFNYICNICASGVFCVPQLVHFQGEFSWLLAPVG